MSNAGDETSAGDEAGRDGADASAERLSAEPEGNGRPSKPGFKPGPLILIAIVLAVFALVQIQRKAARQAASDPVAGSEKVTLVVAVGDGNEQAYPPVPWFEGQTVLDAMEAVREQDKAFTFDYDGHDQFAKLKRIGEHENEGGAPSARNWTYYVNEEFAKESFATHKLSPGARILWKFGTSE